MCLILGWVFFALWNQDCFCHSLESSYILKLRPFPPAAPLEMTNSNPGWKEGAGAASWMLLEIPCCTNKLFTRKFLKNVPWLWEVEKAEMVPTVPMDQEGTILSYTFPLCCDLNSLFVCLQTFQHTYSQLRNPIWPNAVTTDPTTNVGDA